MTVDLARKGSPVEPVIPQMIKHLSQLADPPKTQEKIELTARTWAALLNEHGVSGEELAASALKLFEDHEFFPKPKHVLGACMAVRNKAAFDAWCERNRRNSLNAIELKGTPLADRPDRDQVNEMRNASRARLGLPPVGQDVPDSVPTNTARIPRRLVNEAKTDILEGRP